MNARRLRGVDFLRSRLLEVGPFLVLLVSFWVPILIWGISSGFLEDRSLPKDVSFGTLTWNTLWLAFSTTFSSVLLAYPVALLGWLGRRKGSVALGGIVFMPLAVGFLARNYSWIGVLSGNDTVSSLGLYYLQAEKLLYTKEAVVLVMAYIFIPFAYFILKNAFDAIRVEEIEAAVVLGATDAEVVLKVLFPRTLRQAAIGIVLIFAIALGYFVTPRMLGGGKVDMVGNLVWNYANLGQFAMASRISFWFLLVFSPFYAVSFLLIVLARRRVLGR